MTRRGVIGLFAGVAVGCGLAGCGLLFATKYRFRMTVEVQTPQGIKTGSSVYEVWAAANAARMFPEERARDWGVKGEALVIDLSTGPVFVLLKTDDAMRPDLALMSMTALDPDFDNDVVESAARIAGHWSTRRGAVPRAVWPMMVRFGDINDPKTMERVDPTAIGVKRIALETTGDAVTTGIEKRLPNFAVGSGFDIWYAQLAMDDPRRVTLDDFRKGF
jgi:hypothetical protein